MEVLERRAPPRRKQHDWLVARGYNVTSQNGEDGVLAEIFALLDAREGSGRRWCVEFGAWDGKHLSNTWQLLFNARERWSGVLIEADAERVRQMRAMYAQHDNVTCVNSFIALDGDDTLERILARECPALPEAFDLLSVDVDGADYHIWAELEAYKPKVVVIEFNPTIPNNIVFVQARSTRVFHGSSLAALIDLGKKKGYELVSTTTFNAFFVQRQFYPLFNIIDNDIDKMHDVTMPTEFFQLYDGTLKIAGCTKLLWKRRAIPEHAIQVVPASERSFPFQPKDHDAVAEARKHCDACRESGTVDFAFFVTSAKQARADKFQSEDVRRILRMAIEVCQSSLDAKESAGSAVWGLCEEWAKEEIAQSHQEEAIEWYREMLRARPRCSPSDRARVMATIGEYRARLRQFDEAEIELQTALAIDPQHKGALKSLAKVYTKTGQTELRDQVIDQLRSL